MKAFKEEKEEQGKVYAMKNEMKNVSSFV